MKYLIPKTLINEYSYYTSNNYGDVASFIEMYISGIPSQGEWLADFEAYDKILTESFTFNVDYIDFISSIDTSKNTICCIGTPGIYKLLPMINNLPLISSEYVIGGMRYFDNMYYINKNEASIMIDKNFSDTTITFVGSGIFHICTKPLEFGYIKLHGCDGSFICDKFNLIINDTHINELWYKQLVNS